MIITLDNKCIEYQFNSNKECLENGEDKYNLVEQQKEKNSALGLLEKEMKNKTIKDISESVKLVQIESKYNLVTRMFKSEKTEVRVKEVVIGGRDLVVIGGPCAVSDEQRLLDIAKGLSSVGGKILRGGAYKPRSSPYSFQGLGEEGLGMLLRVKEQTGLPIITELMDASQIDEVYNVADIIQIGARNMQNFSLLKEVGKLKKPILLKRGFCATVEEWLMAAEYILREGNENVILCERGIRTFETGTRNTLDLSSVARIKIISHLPVIVDPSHGTGRSELVIPMAKAAIAAGADGLIIEADVNPELSVCDREQTISMKDLDKLFSELREIAKALGRSI